MDYLAKYAPEGKSPRGQRLGWALDIICQRSQGRRRKKVLQRDFDLGGLPNSRYDLRRPKRMAA